MTLYYGGPVHMPTLYVALGTIIVAIGLRWINRRFQYGSDASTLAPLADEWARAGPECDIA